MRCSCNFTNKNEDLLSFVEKAPRGVRGFSLWDTAVTEHHVVPVHRAMCKYTIIPNSPCLTAHRVPLKPTYTSIIEKLL